MKPTEPPPVIERPSVDSGLTLTDVTALRAQYGFNEVVPKKEKFILTLLKKFIGPVEIILELLAIYFFLIAPFIPSSASRTSSQAPSPSNTSLTNVTSSISANVTSPSSNPSSATEQSLHTVSRYPTLSQPFSHKAKPLQT